MKLLITDVSSRSLMPHEAYWHRILSTFQALSRINCETSIFLLSPIVHSKILIFLLHSTNNI